MGDQGSQNDLIESLERITNRLPQPYGVGPGGKGDSGVMTVV